MADPLQHSASHDTQRVAIFDHSVRARELTDGSQPAANFEFAAGALGSGRCMLRFGWTAVRDISRSPFRARFTVAAVDGPVSSSVSIGERAAAAEISRPMVRESTVSAATMDTANNGRVFWTENRD